MFSQCCLFNIPEILIEFNSWKIVLQIKLNGPFYEEHKEYRLQVK